MWWTGGRFVPYEALGVRHHLGDPLASVQMGDGSPVPVTFLRGCVVLFRASALRACGGFRAESFAYLEYEEPGLRFTHPGSTLMWVRQELAWRTPPHRRARGRAGTAIATGGGWRDCPAGSGSAAACVRRALITSVPKGFDSSTEFSTGPDSALELGRRPSRSLDGQRSRYSY